MHKFVLTSGLSDLTSKQFYYVKAQSIPSQVNFVVTRGMSLQPWSLQEGIPVLAFAKYTQGASIGTTTYSLSAAHVEWVKEE